MSLPRCESCYQPLQRQHAARWWRCTHCGRRVCDEHLARLGPVAHWWRRLQGLAVRSPV